MSRTFLSRNSSQYNFSLPLFFIISRHSLVLDMDHGGILVIPSISSWGTAWLSESISLLSKGSRNQGFCRCNFSSDGKSILIREKGILPHPASNLESFIYFHLAFKCCSNETQRFRCHNLQAPEMSVFAYEHQDISENFQIRNDEAKWEDAK